MDSTPDIFKKSFVALSQGSMQIGFLEVAINIAMAFIAGLFIQYIYRKTYQGVLYQRSFSMTLVLVSAITCLILMTIRGNLVLSLGLVGALSIVRFRTPIKDTLDLAFLYWAISAGIASAVGFYTLTVLGSVLIGLALYLMSHQASKDASFLLVVRTSGDEDGSNILAPIAEYVHRWEIKSQVAAENFMEYTIEVRLKDGENTDSALINHLRGLPGISNVSMIAFRSDLAAV